jgi:periplasmic protein TonB
MGVTGGQLIHRVPPVYPAQAVSQKLQGTVVLSAMVMEDGSLRDVKVVEGPQLLALSAAEAVKQWRYKPYALDGKPVKNEVRISVDFKIPQNH